MATTASVSLTSPSVIGNAPTNFVVTAGNTGASPVSVTGIQVVVTPSVPMAIGDVGGLTPGTPVSIAASGTLTFPLQVVFQAPSAPGQSGQASGIYSLFVIVNTSDGTSTASAPINVFPSPVMPAQQGAAPSAGQLVFDSPLSSALWFFFA